MESRPKEIIQDQSWRKKGLKEIKKGERKLPCSVLLLSFCVALKKKNHVMTSLSRQCLAPLTLPWLSYYYDAPCGACVRSGCSDCCARTTGAVTEGLQGPSSSDTRCDNMTRCFCTGTADVGGTQQSEYTLGQTKTASLRLRSGHLR